MEAKKVKMLKNIDKCMNNVYDYYKRMQKHSNIVEKIVQDCGVGVHFVCKSAYGIEKNDRRDIQIH
ncbi:hypothetical protein HGO97_010395 [Faecalicatena sp. AGMB00832]|uniref:Uncharacterized protein n=1 Tax=Faecalicatena faecalis TaxID=2726362 RepID=A0ABS6D4W2_9FIRM|nr:hypothetical protein [Faecalicatena faecalis]MBU3876221.1 hypothetical protein [Faecalicatena faecalis]